MGWLGRDGQSLGVCAGWARPAVALWKMLLALKKNAGWKPELPGGYAMD